MNMNAVTQAAYGPPAVLSFTQVPRPEPAEDGVLVRVVAAGVTRGDWHLLTGTPYAIRLAGYGLTRPSKPTLGMAVAGEVVAVGARVTTLQVGDAVLAEVDRGGYAEFVTAPATAFAKKPEGVSFDDAAALPVSATTALQALRDAGGLQAGQSVLVNGAAGGVGTFAVQIARELGAVVTGVCSARNAELVRSLGAAHVVDYAQADFTAGEARYDLILDLMGNHPLAACRRVLTPKGKLLAAAGGADHPWVGPMVGMFAGLASNAFAAQPFVPVMAKPNAADLATVAGWVAEGKLRVVIDRRYPLAEVPEALRYLGEGHTRGKSVVVM